MSTGRLVLLRHGQSIWNLENLFTGWIDVDLSEQGRREAEEAGRLLRDEGIAFDIAFTSVLKRAIRAFQNGSTRASVSFSDSDDGISPAGTPA